MCFIDLFPAEPVVTFESKYIFDETIKLTHWADIVARINQLCLRQCRPAFSKSTPKQGT